MATRLRIVENENCTQLIMGKGKKPNTTWSIKQISRKKSSKESLKNLKEQRQSANEILLVLIGYSYQGSRFICLIWFIK